MKEMPFDKDGLLPNISLTIAMRATIPLFDSSLNTGMTAFSEFLRLSVDLKKLTPSRILLKRCGELDKYDGEFQTIYTEFSRNYFLSTPYDK
jgi:hypothetical protein